MKTIINIISQELNITTKQVMNVVALLDDGATIPFISRYRKEATGSLDEVQIATINDRYEQLQQLQHRKEFILAQIEERGLLDNELKIKITNCWDATIIEDIYLPFKPKRYTRAQKARERGLEPLAKIIMSNNNGFLQVDRFLNNDVKDKNNALQGARDIIAEWINEDSKIRNRLRSIYRRSAVIESKIITGKEIEGDKYECYFNHREPLNRCSSHRLLAILRGEKEGFLKVTIKPIENAEENLAQLVVKSNNHECAEQIRLALSDCLKRLLFPSIENEIRAEARNRAESKAIDVFAHNLRNLLLASPLGQHNVLAIDPGFRTGCKTVCLDSEGNLLDNVTIFPHSTDNERIAAKMEICDLVEEYNIEAIAIGRGTAGRETREFIESLNLPSDVKIFMVNEDGASVYSASKIARDEFPEYDVTVRGAVSIGRRLMDPLAELVKIDPKSIGVGQYQHDVDPNALKQRLDHTVMSCVNSVGVNLNTASVQLLSYVSGLGTKLAQNIVDYRSKNGAFIQRSDLHSVPRLGTKAYEQCAGFLRIPGGTNPLDNTAVHPERYDLVKQIADDLHLSINDLITNKEVHKKLEPEKYISNEIGIETLTDILMELDKPGRDPRSKLEEFKFDSNIKSIDDLEIGMELTGIVDNVTNFGCFVDLGIKSKGLVHISQMSDKKVSDPNKIVKINDKICVKIISVDKNRNRIGLTMRF